MAVGDTVAEGDLAMQDTGDRFATKKTGQEETDNRAEFTADQGVDRPPERAKEGAAGDIEWGIGDDGDHDGDDTQQDKGQRRPPPCSLQQIRNPVGIKEFRRHRPPGEKAENDENEDQECRLDPGEKVVWGIIHLATQLHKKTIKFRAPPCKSLRL